MPSVEVEEDTRKRATEEKKKALDTVEQDALIPPNPCGKLEDPAVMCVCCLVVFYLFIHTLTLK